MLMANCLINRFGLFYCHSLHSSSRCKMADWCVCLFTDIPLRLVSSALSSPLSSDVSVSLSAQNMVISESSVLLYAYADIMHNIFVLICLYVGCLWGHGFIWATQRHHIPVLSFTLIQFDFLAPLADLFICAYRNALHQTEQWVWVHVRWWAVLWQCNFFLSLWDRCLWSFLPWVHLPSPASTRGEVQQPFWLYYAYARSHSCTSARGSFAVLLFPSSQEWALAHGWLSQVCFLDRENRQEEWRGVP